MSVTDFLSGAAVVFARELMGAPDETSAGDEVLDARKALNVVDLVEYDE